MATHWILLVLALAMPSGCGSLAYGAGADGAEAPLENKSAPAGSWLDAVSQGNRQFDQGLYQKAIAQYEFALAESDSLIHRGETLYRLAVAHAKLGQYSQAEQHYREALGIFRAAGDSPGIALSLAGLGEIYRNEYRPEQALALERENLTALEQIGRGRSAEAAAILNVTGAILFERRRYKEAERDMRRALAIQSGISGAESLDVAMILNNLGAAVLAQGRLPEAEALVMRGLAIRKALLPPSHPLLASAMLSLASVYREQQRYVEADRLCRDSIEMMSRYLPPEHPDLIRSWMLLAEIAHNAGHPATALGILEKVVARAGQNHLATTAEYVQLLNLYSGYLKASGEQEKSRRIHDESQKALRDLNRPSQSNTTVAAGELTAGNTSL